MQTISEGQKVRYIGKAIYPGFGAVGTFAMADNFDLYCGAKIGTVPAFIDRDGNGHFCDMAELEPVN